VPERKKDMVKENKTRKRNVRLRKGKLGRYMVNSELQEGIACKKKRKKKQHNQKRGGRGPRFKSYNGSSKFGTRARKKTEGNVDLNSRERVSWG